VIYSPYNRKSKNTSLIWNHLQKILGRKIGKTVFQSGVEEWRGGV
jgi:hypothetical protein